jgi:hypothetical protein
VRLLREIISLSNNFRENLFALRIKRNIQRGLRWRLIQDQTVIFLFHIFQSLLLNVNNQSICKLSTMKCIKRDHLLFCFQLCSRLLRVLPNNNSSNCRRPLLLEAYPTKSIIIFDSHFSPQPHPTLIIMILLLLRNLQEMSLSLLLTKTFMALGWVRFQL